MPKILNTESRQRSKKLREKEVKHLHVRGWRYDGLWWYSPYSGTRYMKREAIHVEEIRKWGEGESAFLKDKDHSMWVKKLEEDYALTTPEEAAEVAKQEQLIKQRGSDSNFGKNRL